MNEFHVYFAVLVVLGLLAVVDCVQRYIQPQDWEPTVPQRSAHMGQPRETIYLRGRNIRRSKTDGGMVMLRADSWDDDACFEYPWDLSLGEAPPYQHLAKHPEAMPSYLFDEHLLEFPAPLADFSANNPGITFTARGLEVDATQLHGSGIEWLNGTPLIFDSFTGITMRAIVTHEGGAPPAGYDGYVHVGFRTNAPQVSTDEVFFGVGIFGQGAGPNPFPGARTIAAPGFGILQSTYPMTSTFGAGGAVMIVASWRLDRTGAGVERVTLQVDFVGLDAGHQETQTFQTTDAADIEKFRDLHGRHLFPAISTYHPSTVTEPSIFIISDFRARS